MPISRDQVHALVKSINRRKLAPRAEHIRKALQEQGAVPREIDAIIKDLEAYPHFHKCRHLDVAVAEPKPAAPVKKRARAVPKRAASSGKKAKK